MGQGRSRLEEEDRKWRCGLSRHYVLISGQGRALLKPGLRCLNGTQNRTEATRSETMWFKR